MNNPARRRRAIVLAVVAMLGLSAVALAFWSAAGSGSASGTVGTLAAPTGVSASATPGSSTVEVSWTASSPVNGISASGYYVERHHGASASIAGGSCGTPAAPVSQVSCNDSEVADGTYTYAVVAVYHSWTAESAQSSSVTVAGDATPPTTTLTTIPASPEGTNGWFKKSSVSFTLSAEDTGSGVPAGSTRYTIDGGSTQVYSGAVTISSQGDHTVTYWSVDGAGNEETPHNSAHIKLDSAMPTNALSLGAASHALLSGSTVYFNGGLSGSFTLINAVSDATSGPASATFPLVGAANWTHAAETVGTPSGGAYTSSSYSWTSGAGTPSGAEAAFTSNDDAGNSSANANLTFASDTTAPTGGALTVNGTAASGGGTTSTATSTSFGIGLRTDYAETQSPTQSGLASSTLTIQSETLSANSCGAPGSGGAYTTPTTIAGTTNPATASGFCYLYTLTGTDNVGNAVAITTTVKVDTTGPSSPTVSLSSATGNTFISGTTAYIAAQAGKSGSFAATGSSADGETGVATIKLPALTGFSGGGGTLSSPFETTYSWSGAVGASGAQSATATNGAGLTATNASAFTVTSDTTAPAGGALTVNGTAASAGGTTSTATNATFAIGVRTDYSEAQSASQSGLASSTLTIQSETLSANTCGEPGSGGAYSSPTTISGTTNPTTATGFCYLYTLTGTDKVGNAASVKTTVKVDSVGPTNALSLGSSSGAFLNGSTLYFNSGVSGSFTLINTVSDASSGPASATFPLVGASKWVHAAQTVSTPAGGPYTSSTYSWTSGAGTPTGAEATFTSKDAAGNTSANTVLTFTADTAAPTAGAVSVNGTAATGAGSTSSSTSTTFAIDSRTDYTDGGSGLASSILTIQSETLSNNTCGAPGSGGAYTSATTITGTTNPATTSGFCYVYTLTGTDNVGNTASVKTTVKVDSVAPTNALSLGSSTSAFLSGSTLYFNSAVSGSFTLINTVSDASSGPASATFPLVSASKWTHAAQTVSTPTGGPYTSSAYSWTSGAGTPSETEATFTSKDNAGNTSANSVLTFTADTTAPSGGSVSVPARVRAASVPVTFSAGTDGGSGIGTASGQLLRAEATYTVGTDSCGSFGGFSNVGSAGPTSPSSDATVANNKCYQYEYKVSDNVGNSVTYGPSSVVKVDTTPPSLTGISSTNGNGILEAGDVLTLTFSEPITASSVPASGTVTQSREGNNAAKLAITGITGTEAWSTGDSAYEEKNTSSIFNETASVSGATVKVTVGSNVSGAANAKAGASNPVTGVVNANVTDLAGNGASASAFSIATKLW